MVIDMDTKEIWDAIHDLSDIRAQYSVFSKEECPKYHACSLAIKALRKLVEEDGCKYCTEYEDLPEHIIDGKPVGRVFDTCIQDDENGWHLETASRDVGIKFCPYCGRELKKVLREV